MAWIDPNNEFAFGQDFGEQQAKIVKQRELAKALLSQGMGSPLQGQMVSGHYVSPSILQYLNQLGNTYVGGELQDKSDKDQASLTAKALEAYMKATSPSEPTPTTVNNEAAPQPVDPAAPASIVDAMVRAKSPYTAKLMEPDNSLPLGSAGPTGAPAQAAPVPIQAEGSPYTDQLKTALQRRATGDAPTPVAPVAPVAAPAQAAPTQNPVADRQKQIYTLLSLAQVQGPIGDMARLQIQNMSKQQADFAMHTDNNGNAYLFDKHTGQIKKIEEAGGRKFKEYLHTPQGVFKTYTNGDTDLMFGVQSIEQAKLVEQAKDREARTTDKRTEFNVKNSEDKAKIQSEISTASATIKNLNELRNLIADGSIKTGAIAGPMLEAGRYIPGTNNAKVDRAKMLIKQLEGGAISSLKGLGSMSNMDFSALQKRLPNFSLDPSANLELIDSMINSLDTASKIGNERLSLYERDGGSNGGVPAYGQRFNGPSSAPAIQQHKQSTGGASFKW